MNGEYEGEEIDPDSNKSHEEKTYTVNFSLWNFLRLKNLLVIKQHYTGSSNEDYLRDWESRFYVPEFNYFFCMATMNTKEIMMIGGFITYS